jgi:hydrogenase expression/formation protein HypD
MGYEEYMPISEKHKVPIIVTGFEPVDILQGVYLAVKQLEENRCEVENQYSRLVRRDGNRPAKELIRQVFEITDRKWRGIGEIPMSGYRLKSEFSDFDAEQLFEVAGIQAQESPLCIAGTILRGLKKPHECPVFAKECNPEHPLGAPMVSSEGACAAYFHYARIRTRQEA